jgi:hypothetical protein
VKILSRQQIQARVDWSLAPDSAKYWIVVCGADGVTHAGLHALWIALDACGRSVLDWSSVAPNFGVRIEQIRTRGEGAYYCVAVIRPM